MQTKNVGQGMIVLGCIVGLGLLTVFFTGVEQRQHNPNQNPQSNKTKQVAEVNLLRNRQGHYIVTGNINRKRVEFLLDTGATDVVIPQAMARELNLKAGRATNLIYRPSRLNPQPLNRGQRAGKLY